MGKNQEVFAIDREVDISASNKKSKEKKVLAKYWI